MRPTARTTTAALALSLTGLAVVTPAQDPPAQPERFAAATAGVVVDVVVRDRRGRPVAGLGPGDFDVYEDGVRQQILAFEPYTPADVPATAEAALAEIERVASGGGSEPGSLSVGPPIIALAWDRLEPESRALAYDAARRLIETKAGGELVGVFLTEMSLRTIQPYTTDASKLEAAVHELATRASTELSREPNPGIDKFLANPETPVTAGAEDGTLPVGTPLPKVDPNYRGPGWMGLAAMMLRMERTYQLMLHDMRGNASMHALMALVDSLGELPGRKTVLFFSEGLTVTPQVEPKYRALIDTANRHNVSVYSVDSAGLRVHSEQARTGRLVRERGGTGIGDGFRHDKWLTDLEENERELRQDPAVSLGILAERTGGLFIDNTNALDLAIDRINDDRRHHYLLSYTSSNPSQDGTYRRIEVKVNRRDMEVRARHGYRAAPAGVTTPVLGYEAPALEALARSPLPTAFPIAARALSVPMPGRTGLMALAVRVNGQALTPLTGADGKTYLAQATIVARVVALDGQELARTSQQYQLTGDLEKRDATLSRDILFFRAPDVGPGRHTMEAVVRDDHGERSSAVRIPIEVPGSGARPIVGDLFVIAAVERAPAGDPSMKEHPLVGNGLLLYPSFGEPISKAAQPELAMALSLVVDPLMPSVEATLALLSGGKPVAQLPLPLDAADPTGRLLQVSRLPTAAIPPGTYELRVTIASGQRTEVRSAAVTIVE